nr:expressed protein [Hymenolepis microstoma]
MVFKPMNTSKILYLFVATSLVIARTPPDVAASKGLTAGKAITAITQEDKINISWVVIGSVIFMASFVIIYQILLNYFYSLKKSVAKKAADPEIQTGENNNELVKESNHNYDKWSIKDENISDTSDGNIDDAENGEEGDDDDDDDDENGDAKNNN